MNMIVQNIIYRAYPKWSFERIDNICKWLQEILAAILYVSVFNGMYRYVRYNDNDAIIRSSMSIGYYCTIDIWFSRFELIVHHMFCIWLESLYHTIPQHHEDIFLISFVMVSTETSTFFLTVRNILLSNDLQWIRQYSWYPFVLDGTQVFILATFFYSRIYAFTRYIVLNHAFLQFYQNNAWKIYCIVYGLYCMNLYWFSLMSCKVYTRLSSKKYIK